MIHAPMQLAATLIAVPLIVPHDHDVAVENEVGRPSHLRR